MLTDPDWKLALWALREEANLYPRRMFVARDVFADMQRAVSEAEPGLPHLPLLDVIVVPELAPGDGYFEYPDGMIRPLKRRASEPGNSKDTETKGQ